MASALVDSLKTLSTVERGGVLVELRRSITVIAVGGSDFNKVFTALNTSGVPQPRSSPSGYPNLVLTTVSPTLTSDPDVVIVDLLYERYGSNVNTMPLGAFIFRGGTALQEVQTEKDNTGAAIEVSHTWPSDDEDWPSQTKVQGGQIDVTLPNATLEAQGVLETDYPGSISDLWIGKLNSSFWNGQAARAWKCIDVNFEPFDLAATPNQYMFTFHFQRSPFGWDPQAIYIDPRTDRPPQNIVPGTGTKTIKYDAVFDFNTLFPS